MSSTQRRTARLALVLGTTAVAVAGLTTASALPSRSASTPSASDLCVTVPAVWVHNQQVYPGGLVCVPWPFGSQPT
ncbi:MAG: hypothetical protein QOJ79_692 [Actinomycetota bacterium]|jgi:hypothetical protein|nr:hypothetical protein [Actinomycetota bacterium]